MGSKKQHTYKIQAEGVDIEVRYGGLAGDYFSLTDMARYRNADNAGFVIQNWMRNRNVIRFLGLWERLNNPDFNYLEFEAIEKEAGVNTLAHQDIAMEFASWLSPEFKLYLFTDYKRLKTEENSRLSLGWNLNRELSKINYRIHTDAIKENLIPKDISRTAQSYIYATEADVLNVALFGQTAKMWRENHPDADGNIRDHATLSQLIVLVNLESMNSELIKLGISRAERAIRLNAMAIDQMKKLSEDDINNRLSGLDNNPSLLS